MNQIKKNGAMDDDVDDALYAAVHRSVHDVVCRSVRNDVVDAVSIPVYRSVHDAVYWSFQDPWVDVGA